MKKLHNITCYYSRFLLIITFVCIIVFTIRNFDKEYRGKIEKVENATKVTSAECTIVSFPSISSGKLKFTSEIRDCSDGNFTGLRVNTVLKNTGERTFNIGDVIVLSDASFFAAMPKTNMGGFDSLKYYKSDNISGTFYSETVPQLAKNGTDIFFRKLSLMRLDFMKNSNKFLKPGIAGIVNALMTGDKSSVSPTDRENLKNCGVFHIIAVSGLHLNIFIMISTFFISSLKIRKWKKSLICAFVCIITSAVVLIFTGFTLSVVRAFVMLVISFGSSLFSRKYNSRNSLLMACVIILMIMPSSFFNIGFCLSALSTLAVILSSEVSKRLRKSSKYKKLFSFRISDVFLTSVFCSAITLPVMATSFGSIALYSPLANFLILPLVAPALFLCIIFLLLSAFGFYFLSSMVALPLSGIIRLILEIARFVSSLPMAVIRLYPLYTLLFLLTVATVVLCIYLNKTKRYMKSIICATVFLVAICSCLVYNNTSDTGRIIFADVGQGDCAIIKLSGNRAAMIDFGSANNEEYVFSEIEQTLIKLNISKLSAVFVSHFHKDHTNGIVYLTQRGFVKKLFLPEYYDITDSESVNQRHCLIDACLKSGTDIEYVESGDRVVLGNGAVFDILTPGKGMFMKANDMSAVIKLTYYDSSFLFTGDVTSEETAKHIKNLSGCNVIKVPHHGGKSKLSKMLFEKTEPQYAVISCGVGNVYNHPSEQTIKDLKTVSTYRTDKMGAITFTFDKNGIKNVSKSR